MLNKQQLLEMTNEEILKHIQKFGSVFVLSISDSEILVQHIFIANNSITSLEYSPAEQFEEIKPNIWYREYILPKVENLAYVLYKNCEAYADEEKYEFERDSLYIEDEYSKNILPFYDENKNVFFNQTYIYPIEKLKNFVNLKTEKLNLYSKSLDEKREILIEYPENYNPRKNYKILLMTDGVCWKYTMEVGQKLNKANFKDFIICYIMQKDRNIELPLNKSFAKFIAHDLTEFLSSKFNILNNKENFIFCGQSFGGLTALYIEKYFPDKIGTIICQSAALWYDKKDELTIYFSSHPFKSRFYYSYGNCEKIYISEKGILFKDYLKSSPKSIFNIFGGGHDYISWEHDIINALQLLK